jgi:antitoxin component YwqK of YwqJK toxin-antitoxin module
LKINSPIILTVCAIVTIACNSKNEPPQVEVKNNDTLLSKTDSGWIYNKQPFNGYMVQVENDGRVVYKLPIIDGNEEGLAIGFYNTGEKLLERKFEHGQKQGVFKQWWPNGNLRYLFNYNHDKYDGKQIVYFHFGKIQEEKNYYNGKEVGVQRIWDSIGNLISNYTVKNNKIYGALSAKDCMPVAR